MHYIVKLPISEQTNSKILQQLLDIWENSVRATHDFLAETDILEIKNQVAGYLSTVPLWVIQQDAKVNPNKLAKNANNNLNDPAKVTRADHNIVAFMSVKYEYQNKLEMLFVSPTYFGQKFGQQLVQYACANLDVKFVDVNEQNPKALGFYEHCGFKIYKRSEKDDQGRLFPILHLYRD